MRPSVIILLGLLPLLAYGWEPYVADVTQQELAPQSEGLDHLEPTSEQIPESYYLARYDIEPADAYEETRLTISREEKSGKYFLETWQTWNDLDHKHPASLVLPPDVKIQIPEDLSNLAYQMWVNALLDVRYDRKAVMGLGGADYIFSTWVRGHAWFHGTTWSPDKDLPPKWMVQAGDDLVRPGRDKSYTVSTCKADLVLLHDRLFDYLKHHSRK